MSSKKNNSGKSRPRNSAFFDLNDDAYGEQPKEPGISLFGEDAAPRKRAQSAPSPADNPNYYNRPKHIKKRRSKRRPKRDRNVTLLVVLIYSIIGFCVCALLITRYSKIIDTDRELDTLETQIEELEAIVEQKTLEVSLKDDIGMVQYEAKNSLGMYYPKNDQIVYIDLESTGLNIEDEPADEEPADTDAPVENGETSE